MLGCRTRPWRYTTLVAIVVSVAGVFPATAAFLSPADRDTIHLTEFLAAEHIHTETMVLCSKIYLIVQQVSLACLYNLLDTIRNMFIQRRIYQGQDPNESLSDKMARLTIRMIIIRHS
ncbi:hypothetical protein YERSI8AC_10003 [Enterobacterales bacterium 8AC]|nr:hypothetical protein YERSI8AC_10003 [Enterobacterales bacterium 8AC]